MTTDNLALEAFGARARRFAFPIPDALMALLYGVAAVMEFYAAEIPQEMRRWTDGLAMALLVEGAFLFMQGTLVDIATRLRKRPPVWVVAVILGGVIATVGGMSGGWHVLRMAWDAGMLAFIPLVLSLAERGVLLWQMPSRTATQKIAARALIANRINTAIGVVVLIVGIIVVVTMGFVPQAGDWSIFLLGAIYFGIAAYDDARVRTRAFAKNPKVLFRYDFIDIHHLDPI